MPTETEEPRTGEPPVEVEEEELEGGPVKTFLEHLEDLRWVLIKSLVAVGVAFVVCLIGGNYVVKVIKRPLEKSVIRYPKHIQLVRVMFGTNVLWDRPIDTNQFAVPPLGTNQFVELRLQPVVNGTNVILGLTIDASPAVATRAQKLNLDLINLGPAAAFVVVTKVALYGGLVLASPFVFYFVACFVFPALKMREKRYVYRGLAFGGGLFAAGITFCYFILMPLALTASVKFSEWLGFQANQWRAEEYIGFVCKFMLGMGLGFEMPVVILVLVKLGILNYRMLSRARRYMIVINFVLGAVLTTPEVITQVLMAIPLQVLYEITVWITWYWERRDRKREEREQEEAGARPG
jgi:sec-independent protein translocase protein TatC